MQRIEHESFPSYALREDLVNAATHRDYSFSGSTLVHVFSNRIEIVSVGGLVKGLTATDIELGISQSRNSKLANVLYRLKWIESYGTGLQRILESYKQSSIQPFWSIGPNSFVVTLPKNKIDIGIQLDEEIENFLQNHDSFTSKQMEVSLGKSKASVRNTIEKLLKQERIEKLGNGPSTHYKRI